MRHVPTPHPRAVRLLALIALLLVPVSVGVGVPGMPAPVPAEASTSVTPMVSSFGAHTCELRADGTVRCWGDNARGQLGDGTTTVRPHRVTVVRADGGALAGVTAITAGGEHTCALLDDETVACWGNNVWGQLGDGTSTRRVHPTAVTGLSGVTAIGAGTDHTCAVVGTGATATVSCWGANQAGQLGRGAENFVANPTAQAVLSDGIGTSPLAGVVSIATGAQHTCALMSDTEVRCWGSNLAKQLGAGSGFATIPTPTSVILSDSVTPLSAVGAITAGQDHTCALLGSGSDRDRARCWGGNASGQLGDGTTTGADHPIFVLDLDGPLIDITAIVAGGNHTCAAIDGGGARCWGDNGFGQVGDGTTVNRPKPDAILLAGTSGTTLTDVAGIAPGSQHTCALLTTGGVRCWGRNQDGQLGDGTFTTRLNPVTVLDSLPVVDPPPPPDPTPSGPTVRCAPDALTVGAEVTCTVTGGEPGIDILWRAAVNPVIASEGVTLDADGRGTFGFTVPPSAAGSVITVELVGWTAPVAIGGGAVVGGAGGPGGPVPTSVPAGEGGVVPGGLYALLGVVAFVGAAGTVLLGRRTPAER